MEKKTDYYLQTKYKTIFNHEYHTERFKELFYTKIPDGWDILNDKYLIIIENKSDKKLIKKGEEQLFNYYDILSDDNKNKYIIYLILGFGFNNESFDYNIYDKNKNKLNITLEELKNTIGNIMNNLNFKLLRNPEKRNLLFNKYHPYFGIYKDKFYNLTYKEHNIDACSAQDVDIVCTYNQFEKELHLYFDGYKTFLIDKKQRASVFCPYIK